MQKTFQFKKGENKVTFQTSDEVVYGCSFHNFISESFVGTFKRKELGSSRNIQLLTEDRRQESFVGQSELAFIILGRRASFVGQSELAFIISGRSASFVGQS